MKKIRKIRILDLCMEQSSNQCHYSNFSDFLQKNNWNIFTESLPCPRSTGTFRNRFTGHLSQQGCRLASNVAEWWLEIFFHLESRPWICNKVVVKNFIRRWRVLVKYWRLFDWLALAFCITLGNMSCILLYRIKLYLYFRSHRSSLLCK